MLYDAGEYFGQEKCLYERVVDLGIKKKKKETERKKRCCYLEEAVVEEYIVRVNVHRESLARYTRTLVHESIGTFTFAAFNQ